MAHIFFHLGIMLDVINSLIAVIHLVLHIFNSFSIQRFSLIYLHVLEWGQTKVTSTAQRAKYGDFLLLLNQGRKY